MSSPSELVARVWHQHMVDRRGCWQEFCPKVLGRPLHHEPAREGSDAADHQRFVVAYQQTLARYREVIGLEPDEIYEPRPSGRGHWLRPLI